VPTARWLRKREAAPDGWLDERSAGCRCLRRVAEVERERIAEERAAERATVPTFRKVASMARLECATSRRRAVDAGQRRAMLRDPGARHRAQRRRKGRIMAALR